MVPNFQGILDVAATAKAKWGMHVECVTNVVPTMNDDRDGLRRIAKWIADCLGRDVPRHVTRFLPYGALGHLRPTPLATLEQARATGLEEGLRFVYLGNVPGHIAENTYCPECGRILVRRTGLGLPEVMLERGACLDCGYHLPGRFR